MFTLPNGKLSHYPITPQPGFNRFTDFYSTCPQCGIKEPVRYFTDDRCLMCIARDENKIIETDPTACFSKKTAIATHQPGYYHPHRKLCEAAPHLLYRSIFNRGCYRCQLLTPLVPARPDSSLSVADQTIKLPRREAFALGFKYYDYGCCKQGHTGPRYVKSGGCLTCLNIKNY